MSNKIAIAFKLQKELLNQKLIVGCLTCKEIFVNMTWKDYLPLLKGDYSTPTKWYNQVILHYCVNPTHEIWSNRTILQNKALNQAFNFTENLDNQLTWNNLSVSDLLKVALEKQQEVKDAPI
jgi:hypothetical protein